MTAAPVPRLVDKHSRTVPEASGPRAMVQSGRLTSRLATVVSTAKLRHCWGSWLMQTAPRLSCTQFRMDEPKTLETRLTKQLATLPTL